MTRQKTIRNAVRLEGVGVHNGRPATVWLKPGPADSGIRFVRSDVQGAPSVVVSPDATRSIAGATVLSGTEFTISTIEHCLAALSGLEIDNAIVEVAGDELPVGDGSAQIYMGALEEAGSVEQDAPRRYLVITETVTHGDDERYARVEPYDGLRISGHVEFSHPTIGTQSLTLDIDRQSFSRELGPARTFGFLKDGERLKALGLALGASLDNTIVLDDSGVMNDGGLRYDDEFVRHKMLDGLGDLAVLGKPVRAHLVLHCSGHEVVQGLVKRIAATPGCYRWESEQET
jgi:UDP-3-O-[3-hydroxymyristoyl] N-acetylglucosamine deacetylase